MDSKDGSVLLRENLAKYKFFLNASPPAIDMKSEGTLGNGFACDERPSLTHAPARI